MENVLGTEFRRVEQRDHLGKPALVGVAIRVYDTTTSTWTEHGKIVSAAAHVNGFFGFAFGSGLHGCVGASLARHAIRGGIAAIAERFSVVVDTDHAYRQSLGSTVFDRARARLR